MSLAEIATPPQQLDTTAAPLIQEWEAIAAVVESRMRNSGYYELHSVSCSFHEGALILRGRVPSYYLKQVAQSLVFHLDGVQELSNRLEVVSPAHQ